MGKKVLVMRRTDFQQVIECFPNPRKEGEKETRLAGFWDDDMYHIPTELRDREEVENDPSYLQIVPYGMVFSPNLETGMDELLTYNPTQNGIIYYKEMKHSVGVDCHLYEPVTDKKDMFSILWEHYIGQLEMVLGHKFLPQELAAVRDTVRVNCRWIYSNQEPEEEHHLCIAFAIRLAVRPEVPKLEQELNSIVWMSLEEIIQKLTYKAMKLDGWGDILLSIIAQEQAEGIPSVAPEDESLLDSLKQPTLQ
jgi:predicted NUDIX family phosphoesterase